MDNYNALLDQADEWLDRNALAEFEAWLDAQENIAVDLAIDKYLMSEQAEIDDLTVIALDLAIDKYLASEQAEIDKLTAEADLDYQDDF